jgi:hypothetical protein
MEEVGRHRRIKSQYYFPTAFDIERLGIEGIKAANEDNKPN